ncbi:MAG: hypothetical protein EOP09_17675 [Proteobacteria bacterium]|nr:MAG: hypothetical protein EOP09_17675 [Pseudomonadota bacterium]
MHCVVMPSPFALFSDTAGRRSMIGLHILQGCSPMSIACCTVTFSETFFTIRQVAIRGGDFFVNPRLELRIPVSGPFETALFVDAGNVWVDPTLADPWNLRYTGGTGLRVSTPIGPVAVDYGINLRRRSWEDFGAFHFSIGLF